MPSKKIFLKRLTDFMNSYSNKDKQFEKKYKLEMNLLREQLTESLSDDLEYIDDHEDVIKMFVILRDVPLRKYMTRAVIKQILFISDYFGKKNLKIGGKD